MTLYAHITDGTIDQIGALPALWLGPTRWHDWRGDPGTWATQPADWGWLPVVEVPRPADTATTTSDPAPVALVAGVPTQQWTPRPWTTEELATQATQAVAATIAADVQTDEGKIEQAITKLATLLGDAATVGSIRAILGPTDAVAGTGSLRALKAQTNTNVVSAASIKAIIGLAIDLGQAVIDDAQATRRIARQTLRLARLQTGYFASADVGTDLGPA